MPYKNREKQKEFMRQWMQERRKQFFAGKLCADCGSVEGLVLFWDGEGKPLGHRVFSFTESRRLEVLSKYMVLCHKCRTLRVSHPLRAKAEELLREGYGTREVARHLGLDREKNVRHYGAVIKRSTLCRCGRTLDHPGYCWARIPIDSANPEGLRNYRRMSQVLNKAKEAIERKQRDARKQRG